MEYRLLAERYNEVKERELLEEGFPFIPLVLAGLIGYKLYDVYQQGGIDPEWQKLAEESTWYNVISIFDPTGIMSWPYVPYAWEKYEQDDSWWNAFFFLLACLSVVPVLGLGAKTITKILTSPITLPIWLVRAIPDVFKSLGSKLSRSSKLTNETIPEIIAKASQTTYKGKNLGDTMRKSLDQTMGIKVTDDAIENAAKRLGIKRAAAKAGRAAVGAAKLGGRIGRTATAIGMMQDNKISDQIKKAFNTPRTPAVYGPKVGFGQIGGGVQYGPPSN